MVDWNEDGLIDLISGEFGGNISYFRNIGTSGNPLLTFDDFLTCAGQIINVYNNSCPWVDDWNEDGRKDLLVGSSDGRIWLYLNVGTNANPVFNQIDYVTLADGDTLTAGSRSAPAVVDLNGDGLKDMVCGQVDGVLFFFENQGSNADPQLADYEYLKTGSIGVDVGSTSRAAPLDWDGDGDMDLAIGCMEARLRLYLQSPSTLPAPTLDVIYHGPGNIPATGARLAFQAAVFNASGLPLQFDIWSDVKLPSGLFFGPTVNFNEILLPPFSGTSRNATQLLPERAPGGLYTYHVYAGDRRRLQTYAEDDFSVYKMNSRGEETSGADESSGQRSTDGASGLMIYAVPNPFNPTTAIGYWLAAGCYVNLRIFDTAGRLVVDLVNGWREKGFQQITWNAGGLPSGIYFARLEAEQASIVQKLIFIK